jgi:hypothetical protein
MTQRRTLSRSTLCLGSALILVLLAGSFFLPEIVSTYWHLRFGDSTSFGGRNIPVPKGWWASTRSDLLIIQKSLRFYQSEDAPTISVEVFGPSKQVDPETLKQASMRTITEKGYTFHDDKPIQAGTDRGYCLNFVSAKDDKSIRITCYLLQGHLSLDLFGPSSEAQTFYSVISQIRSEDK